MADLIKDASTGFVPVDELVQLAEVPDDLVAGVNASGILCATAITASITGVSVALGGACPTQACTNYC
ncbi:hypothetical protein AB0O28_05735 [Microbispora sp. NPDC088329]|uniref:hypothetical protein n=1 Tax=unclassified Microbispora TaxID=2614687 RepID=UPI0034298178